LIQSFRDPEFQRSNWRVFGSLKLWISGSFLIVVILVATSEKEVIGTAFGAKVATGKKIGTIFADFTEADRTFVYPSFFFGNLTFHAINSYWHNNLIISELSLTTRLSDT
jgi:hypothetical protein